MQKPPPLHTPSPAIAQAIDHLGKGQLSQALEILQRLPADPEALHLLGLVRYQTGQYKAAVEALEQAIQLHPANPDFYNTCGLAYAALNQPSSVIACFRKVIAFRPEYAPAHNNLGIALRDNGAPEEAAICFQSAIDLQPDYALAHNNLGNTFCLLQRSDTAEACYRRALALMPNFADAHCNLGNVLRERGLLIEASTCYRSALTINPRLIEAHNNLGTLLNEQGQSAEALVCFQQALQLNNEVGATWNNLGNAYFCLGNLTEALACTRKALELDSNLSVAHNNQGGILNSLGRHHDAIISFQAALALQPTYAQAHSNLLFTLQYLPSLESTLTRDMLHQYSEEFEAPLKATWPNFSNPRHAERRLKIGYVSPDLRRHAVANFIEPLLKHHDKSSFEIFCYFTHAQHDQTSDRLQALVDSWVSCVGLNDVQLTRRIQDDGIDILIDLAGHTSGNRMLVFARKPAPVQMIYLGYPGTSGLSAIDYRITDAYADDPSSTQFYSEQLVRLPHSIWCYQPSPDMPEVTPLPALDNGYLTFGSFNSLNKIDDDSIALWTQLLLSLPDSRLRLATIPEGPERNQIRERFLAVGVAAERIEFFGKLPTAEFYKCLQQIDISLDPIHVNGATTSCESLWLGIPFITLVGNRFLERAGLSILNAAGLTRFAAQSRADYLRIGAELAADLPRLAKLRTSMRDRLAQSALMDQVSFARDVESIYRDAWRKWCDAD